MPSSTSKSRKIELGTPLQYLKGVGPMRAAAFARKGVITLQDALYYFPRAYEDRRRLCTPMDLAQLPTGLSVTVAAQVQQHHVRPLRGRKQSLFEITAMGEKSDLMTLTWFRTYPGLKEKLNPGAWAIFRGKLAKYHGSPQIVHPEFELLKGRPDPSKFASDSIHWGRVIPVYSRSEKLGQRFIRETMHKCLALGIPLIKDLLPPSILQKHHLPSLAESLGAMHFPEEMPEMHAERTEELSPFQRRLIFEEFFKFQLVLLMDRAGIQPEPAIPMQIKGKLAQELRAKLPYTLTQAQERVIAEVLTDLQKPVAMNRIVQGDVGSGKTFVAFFAAVEAIENGMQAALLAPTEILAEQHYQNAVKFFGDSGIKITLLTGSQPNSVKSSAQEAIRSGEAQFVIGTHALIQESVSWKKLGLVIVDEQHRFGVRQRAALKEKAPAGSFPHILTMTATPIPRSLALTIFGELDVSTIDELPPGRQEIITKVLAGKDRQKLYNTIHREASQKKQSYIVYPLVNDSDKEGMEKVKSVEAELKRLESGPLAGLRLAMVHGQMKAEQRNEIMRAFKEHKYDVLISTTVIEVGVDVPNATIMAIENAERFGLSQLHQLRGRVGRGQHKSCCVLLTDSAPPGVRSVENAEEGIEEESPWERLLVLERSANGFEISEADLKLRGPGDFFGTKQSGSPSFRLADLTRDQNLLELARKEAAEIHRIDPGLQRPEHASLGAWFHKALEDAATTLKSG